MSSKARQPLVAFMTSALEDAGCKIIHATRPDRAPFAIVFETAEGERLGIVAYAFLATRTPTKNRPDDERSFQIKYGSKEDYADDNLHELWRDPMGMFTTMLIGIDPTQGICVSADPVIHNPTKFFIRLEFKDEDADSIATRGWHAWQRIKRRAPVGGFRVETVVGATKPRFLDLVRFERAARDLDPGNRLILAERHSLSLPISKGMQDASVNSLVEAVTSEHPLAKQFALSSDEILDLIMNARRLKMAVRGWVAEEHLRSTLSQVPGVTHCERLDEEGGPDLRVAYRGGPPLTIECKNVAREKDKHGNAKIDFQRTRAAKGNPCSRYYEPTEFDIVAACLHAVTAEWDFRFVLPRSLPQHKVCAGRISSNIRVDSLWLANAEEMFRAAYAYKGAPI
ncbi:MAG: hypothetical protein AB7O88_27480 [Reyranellaceae bacterium]